MLRFMGVRVIISTVLVFSGTEEISAQSAPRKDSLKFLGREVTIVQPEFDADGFPRVQIPARSFALRDCRDGSAIHLLQNFGEIL
jgi:hypothetical protein